jgi:hypothetical protein
VRFIGDIAMGAISELGEEQVPMATSKFLHDQQYMRRGADTFYDGNATHPQAPRSHCVHLFNCKGLFIRISLLSRNFIPLQVITHSFSLEVRIYRRGSPHPDA